MPSALINEGPATNHGSWRRIVSHFRRLTNYRRPHTPERDGGEISLSATSRPSFVGWLLVAFPDLAALGMMGGIAWGLWNIPPAADRTFAILPEPHAGAVDSSLAYPYRKQIVTNYVASAVSFGVPLLGIALIQARVRSFWDTHNAVLGLVSALVMSALAQFTIKWLVGGLRPHFLDVCQPNMALAAKRGGNRTGLEGTGYQGMMWTSDICSSGDRTSMAIALTSFPSGHTTGCFAGFLYLSLYINAKLKVFSNYRPAIWKVALFHMPLLAATLIGGSLTVDRSHHWYDVVGGATLGIIFALSSYRMSYASIWDFRYNHIPLQGDKPLDYEYNEGTKHGQVLLPHLTATARTPLNGVSDPPEEKSTSRANPPEPDLPSLGAHRGSTTAADSCILGLARLDRAENTQPEGNIEPHRAGPRNSDSIV